MLFATKGAKLEIGGALAMKSTDFAEADFTGESWTEIKNLENLGTVGDSSEEITFDAIDEGRRKRLKGVRDAGNMEIVLGVDYSDAGQVALLAAEKTKDSYAFRITFNDAPSGGTPSERIFIALVMSVQEQMDTANNVTKLAATLAVNSNIVKVDAAEAA